jgi:hypothetical protein
VGGDFNYSEALNQGLKYISTAYVLIISSHTELKDPNAIEYALALLTSNQGIGAAYWDRGPLENSGLRHTLVDKTNFDGRNGMSNACGLIRMELLRKRNFRREVFTAEDQEWAKWLFNVENKAIARIYGAGMQYRNRNIKSRKARLRKRLNEEISIAYFTRRKLLGFRKCFSIVYNVVNPSEPLLSEERLFNFLLFFRLVSCYFRQPKCKSKYF